jgi:hypothetical protein
MNKRLVRVEQLKTDAGDVSRAVLIIRETFRDPASNPIDQLALEPLPDFVVDKLLDEADQLFKKNKHKQT